MLRQVLEGIHHGFRRRAKGILAMRSNGPILARLPPAPPDTEVVAMHINHTSSAPASAAHPQDHGQTTRGHYRRLLIMTVVSFAAMYVLMYAMVDSLANVHNNVNQVYMAGLMAAAMVVIELAVMGVMYPTRKLNATLVALSIVTLVGCWGLIRAQAAVGDVQFLRSMIPHHAGAILMCEKAPIRDAAIKDLCKTIIASQDAEIRQMKAKLEALSQ
jgi:hypothetical protein